MDRREYDISIHVNGVFINKMIIDTHYENKHAGSVSDELILNLAKQLSGRRFEPDNVASPYSYFVTDRMELDGKLYKLIWLLEDHQIYIGIINAYRR